MCVCIYNFVSSIQIRTPNTILLFLPRGRKRKKTMSNKDKVITIRATEQEKAQLQKRAQETGLSLSEFCRRCSLEKKIHGRLSKEELTIYGQLSVFHNNFVRIKNLLKDRDSKFAKEVIATAKQIKIHLNKISST